MIDLSHLKSWTWETEYLSSIFALIPEIDGVALHWKSERLFRRWLPRLRSKFLRDPLILPPTIDEKTVVIILSDELYRVPIRLPALAVFKQYVSDEDKTSIPFPLGTRRGFPELPPKAIRSRSIDVGFVGRAYPHREAFLAEVRNHPKLKRFRMELSCEERLTIEEFAEFLNDTKISICLGGNASPETFRYYESAKQGCIIVSPVMPLNGLYDCHPGVQIGEINDADAVADVLASILETPEENNSLQGRSLNAWKEIYSPQAVAHAIARAAGQNTVLETIKCPRSISAMRSKS